MPFVDCERGCLPLSRSPRVFFIVLFFFGCLGLFFCSLCRCRVFVARLRVVRRPSGGRRLLPLWWSLCFPLRGVGFIIALRWSSPFFSYVVGLRPSMLAEPLFSLVHSPKALYVV